ncbi:MAG: hypothetical protein LBJ62_05300 [Bifidobacteriaceae bacterium]|jgi:hypothetical protein|nr:hypothetical protein [Bifidobacteriaceae bacterium]
MFGVSQSSSQPGRSGRISQSQLYLWFAIAVGVGLTLLLTLSGCGLVDYQNSADKPAEADRASAELDVQNLASQVRTWYASEQANPRLLESGGVQYLCAPENLANPSACTIAGPFGSSATIRLNASGPASFCVEATLDSGELLHQNASGGVEEGGC